jgi:hypothetical protein
VLGFTPTLGQSRGATYAAQEKYYIEKEKTNFQTLMYQKCIETPIPNNNLVEEGRKLNIPSPSPFPRYLVIILSHPT